MNEFKDQGVLDFPPPISGALFRPVKIGWRSARQGIAFVSDQFRKPSEYARFQESLRQLEREGGTCVTESPTPESFLEYRSFYEEQMRLLPQGRVNLPEDWLERHAQRHEETRVYVVRKGGRVVGCMFAFFEAACLHVGYLAVNHEVPGVTAGLQNQLLLDQIKHELRWIYYGKDTNLYGVALSPGLIFNKVRFGMEPFLVPEVPQVSTLFASNISTDTLMCYVPSPSDENQLELHIFTRDANVNTKQYASSNVLNIRVFDLDETLRAHAVLLRAQL